jgi:type II secretory pathway pseudopilin PulG
MNTPKGRRSAVAFTLIELLIVVCIIALLIGILLPALSAARQSGQAGVCMHNIQQTYSGSPVRGC